MKTDKGIFLPSPAALRHFWEDYLFHEKWERQLFRKNYLASLPKPKGRPPIPPAVRQDVLSVGKCAHCGSTERLTVDHVKPYSKGGSHKRRNLQCLCKSCNSRKGAR